MSAEGEQQGTTAARIVFETRRELQRVRNQYWREGVYGEVSEQTHLELAEKTIEMYDVLFEYRGESVLSKEDFPDMSELRSCIGRMTTIYSNAAGDTPNVEPQRVPAVLQIPVDRIYEKSKELDDLANQLGFSAEVKSGKGDLYAIKLNPEDYDDPVSDDVKKPE